MRKRTDASGRCQRLDVVADLGGGYDGESTRWLDMTALKRM